MQPKFGSHFIDPEEGKRNDRMAQESDGADTFPGLPDDMSAFTTPPNHLSARKSRAPLAVGRDKAKRKRKTDDIAQKAVGTVKDYIVETNKVNAQQSAKKWASIENAIVDSPPYTLPQQSMLLVQKGSSLASSCRWFFLRVARASAQMDTSRIARKF